MKSLPYPSFFLHFLFLLVFLIPSLISFPRSVCRSSGAAPDAEKFLLSISLEKKNSRSQAYVNRVRRALQARLSTFRNGNRFLSVGGALMEREKERIKRTQKERGKKVRFVINETF